MKDITEEDLRKGLKIQKQIDVLNELLDEHELSFIFPFDDRLKTILGMKEKELQDLVKEIRSRK